MEIGKSYGRAMAVSNGDTSLTVINQWYTTHPQQWNRALKKNIFF